jgi:integrase
VAFHKDHASQSQSDKVRQTANAFGEYIGWDTPIAQITIHDIQRWLKVRTAGCSKKTFNNLLNDVSRVFSWACSPAQKFLEENPAAAIPRFGSRVLAHGAREILSVQQCIELMHFLEQHHPEWVFPFALMLFVGVRPGYYHGEIHKLMQCANRDGIETYISNGALRLTAEITKDRRARQIPLPSNLLAWIQQHMPRTGGFRLGSKESYAEIREKFKIPHDGLRHTAISAHVTKNGSFAVAAVEFGNSEKIIRNNYYTRMSDGDAKAFYEIYPAP